MCIAFVRLYRHLSKPHGLPHIGCTMCVPVQLNCTVCRCRSTSSVSIAKWSSRILKEITVSCVSLHNSSYEKKIRKARAQIMLVERLTMSSHSLNELLLDFFFILFVRLFFVFCFILILFDSLNNKEIVF